MSEKLDISPLTQEVVGLQNKFKETQLVIGDSFMRVMRLLHKAGWQGVEIASERGSF